MFSFETTVSIFKYDTYNKKWIPLKKNTNIKFTYLDPDFHLQMGKLAYKLEPKITTKKTNHDIWKINIVVITKNTPAPIFLLIVFQNKAQKNSFSKWIVDLSSAQDTSSGKRSLSTTPVESIEECTPLPKFIYKLEKNNNSNLNMDINTETIEEVESSDIILSQLKVNITNMKNILNQNDQWIDKYRPHHIQDLYLHSKKLADM
eukprot:48385_1